MEYLNLFTQHQAEEGIYYRSANIACEHRFTTRTGMPGYPIVTAKQLHSATVLYVTGEGAYACDGFVTDTPGLAIAVKTADCVPILFYDPIRRIAGAAHAGWRGTIAGVAAECVALMERHGAVRSHIQVAVGASIRACCYEVREDFRAAVEKALSTAYADRFVRPYKNAVDTFFADVAGLNCALLMEAGILPAHISLCDACTHCQPALFHSYRAEGAGYGRMYASIRIDNTVTL